MYHENKNQLLTLYYHDGSEREEKRIREHVQSCASCQENLRLLKQTGGTLDLWNDEQPLPNTLDLILENIPAVQPAALRKTPFLSVLPFFHIVFSILFIVSIIYIVQDKISSLPMWHALEQTWIVQAIGSFGVVTFLFFCIGTFITLAIFPTLFFNFQERKSFNGAC